MTINQYSKPAEMQMINTYVPVPFDMMMAAGQAGQKRIEDVMQLQGVADTALGQVDYLKALPSSHANIGQYQLGEEERVNKKVDYYRDKMSSILKDGSSLLGIAPKMQLTSLINEMKKDFSPTGTFGTAKQNKETALKYFEEMQKNQDKENYPWVMEQYENAFKNFSERSLSGEEATLAPYASIRKGEDPFEIASDASLGKLKDRWLSDYKGTGSPTEEWDRLVATKGLAIDDVRMALAAELQGNEKLQSILNTQARWNLVDQGKDLTLENIKAERKTLDKNLELRALTTYVHKDLVNKWLSNTTGIDRSKDQQPILNEEFTMAKHSPFENYNFQDVYSNKKAAATNLAALEKEKTAYLKSEGIQDVRNASQLQRKILNRMDKDIEVQTNKLKSLTQAMDEGLKLIGIDKKSEGYKLLKQDMDETLTTGIILDYNKRLTTPQLTLQGASDAVLRSNLQNTLSNIAALVEDGSIKLNKNTNTYSWTSKVTNGTKAGKEVRLRDLDIAYSMAKGLVDVFTPDSKETKQFSKYMKEQFKPIDVKVDRYSSPSKQLASNIFIKNLATSIPNFEMSTQLPFDLKAGKFIDNKDDFATLKLTDPGVKFSGFLYNPETNRLEVSYMVPNTSGGVSHISKKAPNNLENILVATDNIDVVEQLVNSQLNDKFNDVYRLKGEGSKVILGEVSSVRDNKYLRSLGLPIKDEDKGVVNTFNVVYEYDDNYKSNVFKVTTTVRDPETNRMKEETVPFTTKEEAISFIKHARTLSLKEWKEGVLKDPYKKK